MFYEEKVIDGILHYKTSPRGSWIPFSATSMTNKYITSQLLVNELTEQVEQLIADGNKVSYDKLTDYASKLYNHK